MALKPWYKVVTPREDLREGRPLDASEFAVHLDHVRDGRAPADYKDPARFFDRTFLTRNLTELAVSVLRRLGGTKVETSAVYNLTTQFGGGKTHALTLLYHLAGAGEGADRWTGGRGLLDAAKVKAAPQAATAVFVGTEFDALEGRGGSDGTPCRHTPWGEIAFQLGGAGAFKVVAKHDADRTAPGGEVIRRMLPKDRPVMILMDELLAFMSRNRRSGLTGQLYNFLQSLSEEARAQDRVVLAVSLPSLLNEMTPEDHADHSRFEKLLDRLGRSMVMSADEETSEIIRRRLFEWGGLPDEARKTATEYADWLVAHRDTLPKWFPVDQARAKILETYPFHPSLLSVFERKWQSLPRFQQTRGILRLLALWVSNAYQAGYKGAHKDALIGMGTAPLDDANFRTATFDQLGAGKLEGAVTTDICGKKESHAVRLDKDATDAIRKARLHQKVLTTIFFESNGGQTSERKLEATLPEIRLAVAEPDLDVANIETALEALSSTCYYLLAEKTSYRFSVTPNLNQMLADRQGTIALAKVEERVRSEVLKVFSSGHGVERCFFPAKSSEIADRPALTLVVLAPEQAAEDKATVAFLEEATRQHGESGRTFKSALIWAVADGPGPLRDEARRLLAWEAIEEDLAADDPQRGQLKESLKKAQRDLKETVWRSYKWVFLLGRDNGWGAPIDLGLVHSSAAESLPKLILTRLRERGELEEAVSPSFLCRNWPPAFKEWSTRSVRDAFFSSPQFPRLTSQEAVREGIAKGVREGTLAYLGKRGDAYEPFHWNQSFAADGVEISEDMFIVPKAVAQAYKERGPAATVEPVGGEGGVTAGPPPVMPPPPSGRPKKITTIPRIRWSGEVPPQKWMNFYMKVLTKFATGGGLRLRVEVEIAPPDGISLQAVDETKVALMELGLKDELDGC